MRWEFNFRFALAVPTTPSSISVIRVICGQTSHPHSRSFACFAGNFPLAKPQTQSTPMTNTPPPQPPPPGDPTMKGSLALFFQAVIVLIGIGVLALMLWEPHLEGRNAHATTFEIYFKDPFLAYVYVGSTPFFLALYRAFGLFGHVSKSAMFFLGAGETHPALHNPDYDFPDDLIPIAACAFMRVARNLTD